MSEDRQDQSALMSRIAKLLAMANHQNSNEHEAANAARLVQELLQQHGLTLAEIEAAGGRADDGGREKRTIKRSSMYAWQTNLMHKIAETNFCLHRIHQERSEEPPYRMARRHMLIGRKINVEASHLVYDYLVTTMKRLVSEAGYAPGRHSEKDYHAWLDGCTARLCQRLQGKFEEAQRADEERKAKMAAECGGGRSLVLADVYGSERDLNNDMLNGYPPGTTAARRREAEERQQRQQEAHDRFVDEGVPDLEAWYRAYGYGAEQAHAMATEPDKPASSRNRRSERGRGSSWTRSDQRAYDRAQSTAYRQGSAAGDEIGLDPQVRRDRRGSIK